MGDGTLLVGGREQFRLFDPESLADRPEGPALVLVSAEDGKTIWTKRAPAGSDLHVLGTDPDSGRAFVQERTAEDGPTRLTALDDKGDQVWSRTPTREATFDATLMSGRILVRAGNRWSAYDTEDGRRLWTRLLPERPQFLPYGFELDSVPLLDADHALIGGTTALHTLDLRTGTMTSAPVADRRHQHDLLALPARGQRRPDRGRHEHRRGRRTPGVGAAVSLGPE